MRITIFNANDSLNDPTLDNLVGDLTNSLSNQHSVTQVDLRDLDLKYCTGCWSCWVKTPGQCVIKDDMAMIHSAFINADLVLFAAPMKMGFPNALMKKVNDRLVALVHPYIELVEGECHHLKRYLNYPDWGLLLQEEIPGSEEDVKLVSAIYERTALNIKAQLRFTATTKQTLKDIVYEVNNI